MKIFVSYARVDKPYCVQIIDLLDVHEVWYDDRLYAGQNWWREILWRLEWCEAFVYLLSPDSVTSQYCLQEFELAQKFGKPIIPVLIHPETDVPELLRELQYADLSRGLNGDGIRVLLNSIYMASQELQRNDSPQQNITHKLISGPPHDPSSVISMSVEAMESGKFDEAVFLLKQAKMKGFTSRFIDIEELLNEAEKALEAQSYRREADREYQQIAVLVNHDATFRLGVEAFESFREYYPNYDPDNLAGICGDAIGASNNRRHVPALKLPMLDWCEIEQGAAHFKYLNGGNKLSERIYDVQDFAISKYPVTNLQYDLFLEADDGYANPYWWEFSDHALAWREDHPTPYPSKFRGDERPREMVTWYDAMAFTHWLSHQLEMDITLPTVAEWQYAYQGDTHNQYPWGREFIKAYANTAESRFQMTTLVNRYPENVSPFGVYDMAGNVWEWCLNADKSTGFTTDATLDSKRVVRGGSFMSPGVRSQAGFHFALNASYLYGSIGFRLVYHP